MKRKRKFLAVFSGVLILVLGSYILVQGGTRIFEEWKREVPMMLLETTEKHFFPAFTRSEKREKESLKEWIINKAMMMIPLGGYINEKVHLRQKSKMQLHMR